MTTPEEGRLEEIRKQWESNYWDDRHPYCHKAIGILFSALTTKAETIQKLLDAPPGRLVNIDSAGMREVIDAYSRQAETIREIKEQLRQRNAELAATQQTAIEAILEKNRYQEALTSIAMNTCCDRCQEAALVAREALA